MNWRALCLVIGLLAAPAAWADLPLTVEDLITERGQWRLDLGLTYANLERQGVATGEPIEVQTGAATFVLLPTAIGERIDNSDTFVASLGLRYGLSEHTEIYGRLSALQSRQRSSEPGQISRSHSEGRLADLWLGLNHQFRPDRNGPALLGFAELAVLERQRAANAHARALTLGLTTYTAIDPIVFSLTGAYRLNRSRRDGGEQLQPGNLVLLHPSVGFAVNDRVTLSTGVQWTHRSTARRDGVRQGSDRSATDLVLAVGYGIARGNTLNGTLKLNASGRGGAEFRLNWLYTFQGAAAARSGNRRATGG